MNRRHTALTGLAALAGLTIVAPATADAATECLGTPIIGTYGNPGPPVLTTASTVAPMYISFSGDWYPPDYCSGVTATVQKTDGTHSTVVPFDERGGAGMPPAVHIIANIPIPLTDGAGDWVVTKISHGPDSRAVSVPFRILRGTVTGIDQPAEVTAPAKTTVAGHVRRYTPTGALAPAAATAVRIMHSNGTTLIASAKTDATGHYRVAVPFTVHTTMRAVTPDFTGYQGSASGLVTARVRAALIRLLNSSTAVVNDWWRIDGLVYPGRMWTTLEYWNGSAWINTQSFGYSAPDGTFTRWWKPAAAGTFRVRISISKPGQVDGSPIVREKTVTVVSKQTQATYLTGTVGPTSDPVPVVGTKMSTYGHLKVRFTNGQIGPFANQDVLIQVRRLTTPLGGWENYAGVRTSSTGYYYANWNIAYPQDHEVRVVYTSPYITIKSALLNLGVVDVQ